jgi:N-acylneuraminate cytidylyltransferase
MKIAILPARGGSKRIPRKNIVDFFGLPMISVVINILKNAELFDQIVVSTDDNEIKDASLKAGASVPFMRPAAIADDFTGSDDVVVHAIQELKPKEDALVCCVYPTAVLTLPEDLVRSCEMINQSHWKYVFSAVRYDKPVQRSFIMDKDAGVNMLFPQHYQTRSQDLDPVFYDAGMFYWATVKTWCKDEKVFTPESTILEIPAHRAQDIDTLSDLKEAQSKYRALHGIANLDS